MVSWRRSPVAVYAGGAIAAFGERILRGCDLRRSGARPQLRDGLHQLDAVAEGEAELVQMPLVELEQRCAIDIVVGKGLDVLGQTEGA
jgi:hypothetical protein